MQPAIIILTVPYDRNWEERIQRAMASLYQAATYAWEDH